MWSLKETFHNSLTHPLIYISEVWILTIGKILECQFMRDLRRALNLGAIPRHQDDSCQDHQSNINSVNHDMCQETMQVSGSIFALENLGSNEIADSPANEDHGHCDTLLCLARHIARNQRDNHVALGQEELCAVESNEHAACIRSIWGDDEDHNCSDQSRDRAYLFPSLVISDS